MTFRQNLWTILVWFVLDLGCSLTALPNQTEQYTTRGLWSIGPQLHRCTCSRGQAKQPKVLCNFTIFSLAIHPFFACSRVMFAQVVTTWASRSHATLRLLVLSTLGFDAAKFGRDRLAHHCGGIVNDWAGTVFKQRDSVLRTVCFAFFHRHCRRRQSFQGVWCSVIVDSLSLAGIKAYKLSVRKFQDSMIGVGLFGPSQDLEACCIRPEDCDFEDWNDWSSCAVQACGPASWQIQRCAVLELFPQCDDCPALTAFSNHFHWLDVLSQGQWQWGATLSDTRKGRSCEERHFGQQRIASRDLQELSHTLPKYWM